MADLNTKIDLGILAPTLKFSITSVDVILENGPFFGEFSGWGITGDKFKNQKNGLNLPGGNLRLPLQVPKIASNPDAPVNIGSVKFGREVSLGENVAPGRIEIGFQVVGSVALKKGDNPQPCGYRGFITITPTEWGHVQRPDNVQVAYGFLGEPPRSTLLPVPNLRDTPDLKFDFVIGPDMKIGMTPSLSTSLLNKISGGIIDVALQAHQEVANFAIGSKVPGLVEGVNIIGTIPGNVNSRRIKRHYRA
ncbi:uncharacterized protein DFL_009334 [Arthrobotrys flagrans]|uniref:Uncharacterized protein n=1 Tax=Arthrobotrys flagrans TaxID=97331 RepID=A0A436ZRB2_ARTFL|nr:hypothetical protein DFL_009334 [Arthrobotrys flagrans]